jgi:hypothetical protein
VSRAANNESMQMTVTLQIGNSDDKPSQLSWHRFVVSVSERVRFHSSQIHFHGTSPGDSMWQNACWVFEASIRDVDSLKESLAHVKELCHQDSIAITTGETQFI